MGLLSFFKAFFKSETSEVSKTNEKIEVAPVVTPDPVVVDTESANEVTKVEKKKRVTKVIGEQRTEKKVIQKKIKK